MNEVKPLLKDEEEKLYILKEEKKISKEKLTTIILSVIVAWLMWYSFYPFCVGFYYYDEVHGNEQTITENE